MIKVRFDREVVVGKLQRAIKFIPSKTITPCFDSFKLTSVAGVMEIVASDGNVQFKTNCPVSTKEDFSVCVPAKLFLSTIALMRENEVVFEVKEKQVVLKNGKSKYQIGLDTFPDDFPIMKLGTPDSEITLHQFFLKQAFESTVKFVNEKNPQPQMVGINMLEKNNRIIFTGLDGQILCRCAIKPISINAWNPIVSPTDTAKKVSALCEDKGEISVTHSLDKIMFYTSADSPEVFEVMSVLTNQKYPNSEALFKNKTEENLVINTLEFSDAIKRLNLYTFDGTAPIVVIKTNPENLQELILTAQDDLTNKDGEEIMTVINVTGKQIHKAYNSEYLLKALGSIEENEFVFFYNEDHTKPSFMEPKVATETESAFNFLVSAIKL